MLPPGVYTNVNGNTALAWGLIAAAQCARLPLFYGTYPITPASDILHELAMHKNFGVRTFQAEDEIAAIGSVIGAAFAGNLGVTGTSGPGVALKSEAISLAFTTELPLILIDVQRAGPSTGMPTKVEQSDLLMALFGRHGEAPLPVIAIPTPSEAFELTIEAVRIALKYMTPVILMSRQPRRQQFRALEAARRRQPPRHLGPVRDEPQRPQRRWGRPLPPLHAGPRHVRPPLGRPGNRGPGAPDRRHREGSRHRQRLL